MSKLRKDFIDSGFIFLRNLLDLSEVGLLEDEYDKLIIKAKEIIHHTNKANLPLSEFYKQNPNELVVVPEAINPLDVCRFEYISACSKVINDVVIRKLKSIIDDLMEESFILFKDKCNVKNPGGGAFSPHQDISAYYHFKPKYYVTATVNLDNSNVENGCLEMAIGYKEKFDQITDYADVKFGRFPFFEFYKGGKNNGDIKEEICRDFSWEMIEANIGDVVLFDSFVPHRSQQNLSKNTRRIFFFTFNPESDGDFYQEYYAKKKGDFSNPMFHVSTPTKHNEN
jgi:2-aminoethylphosphonate dioxygenase